MNLDQEVKELTTDWRDIIFEWIENNKQSWESINTNLKTASEQLDGILDIFPRRQDIFRCFQYFNSTETKVVILGQDPYHGKQQATGLCFGVSTHTKKPPSLKNIEKELKNDINKELSDITLEKWAAQGVLLLNTSLTVVEKTPGSHIKFWRNFTKFVIDYINKNCKNVIFVAWGAFAHKRLENVNTEKHSLIVSSHPSPLSYFKPYKNFPSFKGSKPFTKINSLLNTGAVDW